MRETTPNLISQPQESQAGGEVSGENQEDCGGHLVYVYARQRRGGAADPTASGGRSGRQRTRTIEGQLGTWFVDRSCGLGGDGVYV